MLDIRRLTREEDLACFQGHYARRSGYTVPLDYLRAARVFAAGHGEQMRCGFALGSAPPFRTLQRIPDPDRSRCEAQLVLRDTQEFTCVWMALSYRRSWRPIAIFRRLLFWAELLRQGGRLGKRFVLMGTEVPALRDFYESGRPEPLYSGPVIVDGKRRQGWVYVSTIEQRWMGIIRMARHKLRARSRREAAHRLAA